MGKGRIELFKKDNKNHLESLNRFIKDNKDIALDLNSMLETQSNDNELNEYLLYIENDCIKDICHINSLKDIKMSTISLPIKSPKTKKIIIYATNYAIESLNMKQVFIKVSKDDKQTQNYLREEGYEDLGIENDYIIFLKEVYEDINKTSVNNINRS